MGLWRLFNECFEGDVTVAIERDLWTAHYDPFAALVTAYAHGKAGFQGARDFGPNLAY
jgi:hypothetical protein